MHKAREVLRLILEIKLKDREIAESCGVSHGTVNNYRSLIQEQKLSYSQLKHMSDTELEKIIKNKRGRKKQSDRPQPDFDYIHQELQRKGVTRQLLWEEYREFHPDGYGRTQFCDLYNEWSQKLDLSMRQSHKAGEKMFVDYSGQTAQVTDPKTGEIKNAQIFVAVLGASNYTYAEASWSQKLPDFIASHVNAFRFFEGVPAMVIPDNLKSAVNKPCLYDPEINRSYHEMALHYGTVILPARVRKPQDKAKAEVGVQIVQRWILAAIRHRCFFSLEALNLEILDLLGKMNQKPFKKLKGSRIERYEAYDYPNLKPLPQIPYTYAKWSKTRVSNDYHITLDNHYYSVPFTVVTQVVDIRSTPKTVEIFYQNKRIASHKRSQQPDEKTTVLGHMPKSHQMYLEITPSVITDWAVKTGEATHKVIQSIIANKGSEDAAYRTCLGVMRLNKLYPAERIEKACQRALDLGGCSYQSIKSILEKGLDQEQPESIPATQPIVHENIRGKDYFNLNDETIQSGEFLC
ncbi:IS21 family transposase [Candidatus Peregrinibacteria bacterium]|jgi:transposase|nr:IS21 family transposase [Candidatus Peregrinibacteria bacterium]